MRKKGMLLVGIISLLISLAFVSSFEINATNVNLKQNYSMGEFLSGNFSLNVKNIEPDYFLKTNRGHSISLVDFLGLNGRQLQCDSFNCQDSYESISPEMNETNLNTNGLYGLKIQYPSIIDGLSDIQFKLYLTSPEQNQIPLEIKFFEKDAFSWTYQEPTENYIRFQDNGVFNPSISQVTRVIELDTLVCQQVPNLPSTMRALLGVNFTKTGSDSPRIALSLSKSGTTEYTQECEFIASSEGVNTCVINYIEPIPAGNYSLCVVKKSGSADISVVHQPTSNYNSLFIKLPTYKAQTNKEINFNVSGLNIGEEIKSQGYSFLNENYNRNCSEECFIPVSFSGVLTSLSIQGIQTKYSSAGVVLSTNKILELAKLPSTGSFSGLVYLDKAGFRVEFSGQKNVDFSLERGEGQRTRLFGSLLQASPVSIVIRNLYPSIVPAGVSTLFFIDVLSVVPISSYQWIFGDGTTMMTNENRITKTYENITSYNLTVKVFNNQSETSESSFFIEAVNPKDYLNQTIAMKNEHVNRVIQEVELLAIPFKDRIIQSLNLDGIRDALNTIDAERRSATTDSKFLELALRIQDLEVPQTIWVESIIDEPFLINPNQIDLTPLGLLAGKSLTDNSYKEYIANWQIMNVLGNIRTMSVAIIDFNGMQRNLANVYSLSINPKEKSYLIVQNALGVESSIMMQQTGSSKTLELVPGVERNLDLISFNNSNLIIYISPEPSKIGVVEKISPCNFNKVCEKNLGEDYRNCRSDCRPWPMALIFLIVVLVIAIVAYIFVQIQFKKRYELQLFKSEQELKNLVESVNNSRENNIPEKEITDKLIKNGWSKEQVSYAIKKSKGERTRPYEIISFDKILAKISSYKQTNKEDKNNELPKKIEK